MGMRYDDSNYPSREEAVEALDAIKRLRAVILDLLPPEARPS